MRAAIQTYGVAGVTVWVDVVVELWLGRRRKVREGGGLECGARALRCVSCVGKQSSPKPNAHVAARVESSWIILQNTSLRYFMAGVIGRP